MIKNIERKLNPPFYIPDKHPLEYMASNGCMSLQQTNVRMSGNVKTVWKSDDEVYIESISSDDYFSSSKFKKFAVDMRQGYMHNMHMFFDNVDKRESIWKLKDIEATKAEQFSEQYEYLYTWGAYSETNDLIGTRFRFFAPLFTYGKLPDRFIILRINNIIGELEGAITLRDYVNHAELVKSINLKATTNFGAYLRTLTESSNFKQHTLFANFKESFVRYYGFDINSGKMKYVTEPDYDSYLANERTITEYNNCITNGWMRSELICPNIINLEFAFDDPTAPVGFNTYVGFYCYDNEVDKSLADMISAEDGTIVLNEAGNQSQIYKPTSVVLPDYTSIINTTTTTQPDKSLLPPIAEIKLPHMPVPGTILSITYYGAKEVEVYMLGDIIESTTTDEVLQKIANQINNAATFNVVLTASVVDHTLVIRSQVTDEDYESIMVNVPDVFIKSKPTYYSDDAVLNENEEVKSDAELYNTMRMITYRDLFITSTEIPLDCTNIEIDGIDYELEQTFTYRGGNVIRLNAEFATVYNLKSNIIKFKKTNESTFTVLSFIKHVNFDMSMKDSPYYDIFDFNIRDYQIAYANAVRNELLSSDKEDAEFQAAYRDYFHIPENQSFFNEDGTPYINEEFVSAYDKKNVLIKDVDPITLQPNNSVSNEYDRFDESKLVQIRNANLLEPQIAKFVGIHGSDMYGNPVSMNTALPWGATNFLNTGSISVSPESGSHQWFILGAGPFPYPASNNKPFLDSIQKQLGYANIPDNGNYHSLTLNSVLSEFDFTSTEHDAYDALEYKMFREASETRSYYKKQSWATMFQVEGEVDRWNAIFRGTEWSFIGNYEGYRFAVVMITCTNSDRNNTFSSPYNIVDNQVFKTLTLVIINYVPDVLLTSGNGKLPYYIDRSFFYYSSKVYGSSKPMNISDLSSTSPITLKLFDDNAEIPEDTEGYTYIKPWLRIDTNGKPQFRIGYIKPVDSTISLDDIIADDVDTFEWLHVNDADLQNGVSILTRYTAVGIKKYDDHFWCDDIYIEFAPNPVYMAEPNQYGNYTFTHATYTMLMQSIDGLLKINNTSYKIPFWEKIKESKVLPMLNPDGSHRYGISFKNDFYMQQGDSMITFGKEVTKDLQGSLLEHDQYWIAARNLAESGNMLYISNAGTKTISNQMFSAGYAKDVIDSYSLQTYVVNDDEIISTKKSILMITPDETFIIVSIGEKNAELYWLPERYSFKVYRQTGYYGPLFRGILVPESLTVTDNILCVADIDEFDLLPKYLTRPGQFVYFSSKAPFGDGTRGVGRLESTGIFVDQRLNKPVIYVPENQNFDNIPDKVVGQLFYFEQIGKLYELRDGIDLLNLVELKNNKIELANCLLPLKPIPGYVGRKKCTSTDNIDNYCEEVISGYLKNPTTSPTLYAALYGGYEYDVATEAVLAEHRGLLSNTYNNSIEIQCRVPFSETIDLISSSRSAIGPAILSRVYGKEYTILYPEICINALKLYNTEINSSNVIYEDVYERFYERFYLEWFSKHYRVSKVVTDLGYSIKFSYTDISTIALATDKIFSKQINSLTLTFEKI